MFRFLGRYEVNGLIEAAMCNMHQTRVTELVSQPICGLELPH